MAMAKRETNTKTIAETLEKKPSIFAFLKSKQAQTIFGIFLMSFSFFLCIAFLSFFFKGS